ncbi:YHYH protein [Wenyingzhuangia sp. chi5]|uniref:YHYH protein n=1 Tax=Wenyingzhuangia gilva TaxID=3057677 RepID=A0ABT8VUL9_9FLAO|nr:YHYH protein [Wenyingzhuangia sp. chi5]MDO3695656.1 YHYH protein [Wenyingzhuangia sp. chi5]
MNKRIVMIGLISMIVFWNVHSQQTENSQTYFKAYNLEDENFGTQTKVIITKDKRIMVTNALPNHKTGVFPRKGNPNTISSQNNTYKIPLHPTWIGEPQWIREPGVAINGVKFEPGTAEVVICDTGENYRVEAFQSLIDLGLDFNNAHVQPNGAYHYHGIPTSVVADAKDAEDLVHIGFAMDGYPIYYSKSNAYKSSYKLVKGNRAGEDCTYTNPKKTITVNVNDGHDGTYTSDFEYVAGLGDLDECNGITIDGVYRYLVTSEFPYVSRCLMGAFEEEKRRPEVGNQQRGKGQAQRPNSMQMLQHMDANKDGKLSKEEIKGPLQQDFSRVDSNHDGYISKEEIENALKPRP